jgi:hypothetical protein
MSAPVSFVAPFSEDEIARVLPRIPLSALIDHLYEMLGEEDQQAQTRKINLVKSLGAGPITTFVIDAMNFQSVSRAVLKAGAMPDSGSVGVIETPGHINEASDLLVDLARALDAKESGADAEFDRRISALFYDFRNAKVYGEAWDRR